MTPQKTYPQPEECQNCHGKGMVPVKNSATKRTVPCMACKGSGVQYPTYWC